MIFILIFGWIFVMIFCWNSGVVILIVICLDTPPQNRTALASEILLFRMSVRCLDRGLVRRSTSWSLVWTWLTWRMPRWTRSRTKWRSIWMCFILEWWTGLKLRWVAPRLSQRRCSWKPSSYRSEDIHIVSKATLARAIYSTSMDYLATTRCFLELHEIGFEPRKLI